MDGGHLVGWSVIGEHAPAIADPETGIVSNNHNNTGGNGQGSGSHKPINPNHPPFNHVQEVFDYIHSKNYPACKGPPCQHYLGNKPGVPIEGQYPDGEPATWVRHMWEVWHKREHPTCDGKWAAQGNGKWCIHQPGGGYHEGWKGWDDLPDNMQEVWWKSSTTKRTLVRSALGPGNATCTASLKATAIAPTTRSIPVFRSQLSTWETITSGSRTIRFLLGCLKTRPIRTKVGILSY